MEAAKFYYDRYGEEYDIEFRYMPLVTYFLAIVNWDLVIFLYMYLIIKFIVNYFHRTQYYYYSNLSLSWVETR